MIVTAAVGCKRLLGGPQCQPDRCGHAVEFLPRRTVPVVRRKTCGRNHRRLLRERDLLPPFDVHALDQKP